MKKIILLLAGLTALFTIASCTSDLDRLQLKADPTAPQLQAVSPIHITADNLKSPCTFQWTPADFGQPVEIVYTIHIEYAGKTSVLFDNIIGKSHEPAYEELVPKFTDLGIPTGKDVTVSFKLTCTVGSTYRSVESNSVSTTVHID